MTQAFKFRAWKNTASALPLESLNGARVSWFEMDRWVSSVLLWKQFAALWSFGKTCLCSKVHKCNDPLKVSLYYCPKKRKKNNLVGGIVFSWHLTNWIMCKWGLGLFDRKTLCHFNIHDFERRQEVNRINEANSGVLITEYDLRVPLSARSLARKMVTKWQLHGEIWTHVIVLKKQKRHLETNDFGMDVKEVFET